MNIVILGGAGMLGRKLGQLLATRAELRGKAITRLTLADVVKPDPIDVAAMAVDTVACDIADPQAVARVITPDCDVIFHLAAIPSAQAEAAFEAGMQANYFGSYNVLERCRTLGTQPVVVFSSTLAVFGGDVPDPITDASFLNPQTSYGSQKAMVELLVNDYSRRGFIDGRAFRLPTISIRPGAPNGAASSFMSSILREPLNGQEAICPVGRDFPHFYLSPRKCVENLVLGAEVPAEKLGQNRAMTMPGLTLTIGQMIDAMTAVAGPDPAKLIRWESQPEIEAIVNGWRFDIHTDKALSLGLSADASFEDNVRYYLEDDLSQR
ncbi:SDR family oxidoreductase [Alisedimentitalea sp. MJ-SS2]|uniref:D-erythronate dehydrogenase n=1 Tax=Aliisedimentitalea sp. MJ-SS2 TaxID=3049795 RepID=UPI0029157E51|nr:D-erythronate dehydrogenase [Alisedimentitalea sp. MJ-SS2]MDU8925804.1 SDR family oxidoreductase [Alisedimentitalea sp. MJ-SS2]